MDLFDALEAAGHVREMMRGVDREAFDADQMRRWAVERQMEIVGEALNRLRRDDPQVAERVPNVADIIGLRNVLIHGYDVLDMDRVWYAVASKIPELVETLAALLAELGTDAGSSPAQE